MGAKDNKGQAKVKARGTHSKGVNKKKKAAKAKNTEVQSSAATSLPEKSCSLGDGDLRVLLLGEESFGFAAALALTWGDCAKLTATTQSSQSAALSSHVDAVDNVETVKAFGGTLAFRVDPTALHASEAVVRRGAKGYERVLLHLPAASAKQAAHLAVAENEALLRGVFKSVLSNRLLKNGTGELHVTLRLAEAESWSLVALAKLAGLRVKACTPFAAHEYQGYDAPVDEELVTYALFEPPPKVDEAEKKAAAIAAIAKAHPELRMGPTGQTYKEAWKQRHKKAKR